MHIIQSMTTFESEFDSDAEILRSSQKKMELPNDFIRKSQSLIKLRQLLKENQDNLLKAQKYSNDSIEVKEAREYIKIGNKVLVDLMEKIKIISNGLERHKAEIKRSEQKCTLIKSTKFEYSRVYKKSKLLVQCGKIFSDWKDASEEDAQKTYQHFRMEKERSSAQQELLEAQRKLSRQQDLLKNLQQKKKTQTEIIRVAQKILDTAEKSVDNYRIEYYFLISQISCMTEDLNKFKESWHQDLLDSSDINSDTLPTTQDRELVAQN